MRRGTDDGSMTVADAGLDFSTGLLGTLRKLKFGLVVIV